MKYRVAWAEVYARLGQLSVTVLMIGLGVALAAGTLMAQQALEESYARSLRALAGRADLQVTAASGGAFSADFLEDVNATEGVKVASALLSEISHLPGRSDDMLRIVGVDLVHGDSVRLYQTTEGAGAALGGPVLGLLERPGSVIIPRSFAAARGLSKGDPLRIAAPAGATYLTVRSLLEDTGAGQAFGGTFALVDLEAAQEMLGKRGMISQIDVLTDDAEATRAALRDALPEYLAVGSLAGRTDRQIRVIHRFLLNQSVFPLLSIILVSLIASNRMSTIYQSRQREIGVMRALGRSPNQIARRLVLEAAILALLGAAVGVPLGWILSQFIVDPLSDAIMMNFKERVTAPLVSPALWPAIVSAAAAVVGCVAATWFPARSAAGVPVADALDPSRRRDPWPVGRTKRRVRFGLPPLALAMLGFQVFTGSGALSALTPVVALIAGALLLQPGLSLSARLLSQLLGRKRSIGLVDQSRPPSRAAGAAGVLMVGTAIVLMISIMGQSFEDFVASNIAASRDGDLLIESIYDIGPNRPRLTHAVVEEVAAIPGIEIAAAEQTSATKSEGGLDVGMYISDPVRFREPRFGDWVLQEAEPGALEKVAAGEALLVTPQYLQNHEGSAVGANARLLSPTGLVELPIAGVTTTSFLSQTGDVLLSRDLYRERWGDSVVVRIFAFVRDGYNANDVRRQILDAMESKYSIQVTTQEGVYEFMAAGVRAGFAFTGALGLVLLVLVLVGTGDALAADVTERTREIGTLRALGFSPPDVFSMLLSQALAIGLVGVSYGLVIGLVMSVSYIEGLIPDLLGWHLEAHLRDSPALTVSIAGVLSCIAAAAFPALRAARMSPPVALQAE